MKKNIALILAIVLLMCALAACNTDNGGHESSESGGSFIDSLTGVDYGGAEVTFLTCGIYQTASSEILPNSYSDEENSVLEVVNDALSERYNLVEEKIGVVIREQYIYDPSRHGGTMIEHIRNTLASGTDAYQVCVPDLYDAATLSAEGLLIDLNTVPNLDLTSSWWDQSFNSEITIAGHTYFTIGDIGLVNKDATPCIAFNKNLFEEYDLENPYDLVDSGSWTIDKLIEFSKHLSNDLNNDGVIDYSDEFGYGGQYDDIWCMFYGSGERLASIGSDGYPYLTVYNERSVSVVDNILKLMQDDLHYVSANDYFGVSQYPAELVTQAFIDGRSLFNYSDIGDTDDFRDMADDFGLLPIPKYSEEQEEYNTLINCWTSNAFCIPYTVEGETLEMTGLTLELMGAISEDILVHAYYDVALQYQKTRDDDTVRMLDIIFSTRGCDLGMVFQWGGLDTMLHSLITSESGAFASVYETYKGKAEADMKETVDTYKKLN